MVMSSSLKCQLVLLSMTLILGGSYSKSTSVREVSPSKELTLAIATLDDFLQSIEAKRRELSSLHESLGKVEEEVLMICPQENDSMQDLRATLNKIAPLYEAVSAKVKELSEKVILCETPCQDDEFRCVTSGVCMNIERRCNGGRDCSDGSDEENCHDFPCPEEQFKCVASGACMFNEWRCDGERDCSDGSDEDNCLNVSCTVYAFKCVESGLCISIGAQCNKRIDCSDGSDEEGCNPCADNQFQCVKDLNCILKDWHCNGIPNCNDYTDEEGCVNCTNAISCRSGEQCILHRRLCDGDKDCDDGSDEANCGVTSSTESSSVSTTFSTTSTVSSPCEPNPCSHDCIPDVYMPKGYSCLCPIGYALLFDQDKCVPSGDSSNDEYVHNMLSKLPVKSSG
ncbi:low-density lipoprotein receptor-related protein 8-like [Penaeus japonicus]|uniref:low-density lipoprotein receptor-related protein 8-like n=1 Tax=Penaeus japonicus TaxID=27405 RepID=UPI001C70FD58|nr:low-density lipoprotein receptor-related protein 8-like [Penaeus japonicus]